MMPNMAKATVMAARKSIMVGAPAYDRISRAGRRSGSLFAAYFCCGNILLYAGAAIDRRL